MPSITCAYSAVVRSIVRHCPRPPPRCCGRQLHTVVENNTWAQGAQVRGRWFNRNVTRRSCSSSLAGTPKASDPEPPGAGGGVADASTNQSTSNRNARSWVIGKVRRRITKEAAKENYLLSEKDLGDLTCIRKNSQFNFKFHTAPIILYSKEDVEAKARKVWGGLEELEIEKSRRADQQQQRNELSLFHGFDLPLNIYKQRRKEQKRQQAIVAKTSFIRRATMETSRDTRNATKSGNVTMDVNFIELARDQNIPTQSDREQYDRLPVWRKRNLLHAHHQQQRQQQQGCQQQLPLHEKGNFSSLTNFTASKKKFNGGSNNRSTFHAFEGLFNRSISQHRVVNHDSKMYKLSSFDSKTLNGTRATFHHQCDGVDNAASNPSYRASFGCLLPMQLPAYPRDVKRRSGTVLKTLHLPSRRPVQHVGSIYGTPTTSISSANR